MQITFMSHVRKALIVLSVTGMLIALCFSISGTPTASAQGNPYFSIRTVTLENGISLDEIVIKGPPVPPPGYDLERRPVALPKANIAAGTATLTTPAFRWSFGCSATSGAMIAAYYDRNGFSNMYTGPTNGGVMPLDSSPWPDWTDGIGDPYAQCPLTASHNGLDGRTSRGSIDDYWVSYLSNTQDPYITNGWTQHTWGDAIGDYMKTSQSAYDNVDGSTVFYTWTSSTTQLTCDDMVTYDITVDGTYGRKLFYEARGYTVTDCYNQKTDNNRGGFTFAMYEAEIDAGRPVMLNLAGHTIVGVGYDDATNTVYLHDTWDYSTHTMIWGRRPSYSAMELQSVSIVNIVNNHPAISGNAGVTGATLNYTDGTPKTATADASGDYSLAVSSNWSGTVTPSLPGFSFSPPNRVYTNIKLDQTDQDFTATPAQSLPLATGWNLVSFRLHPTSTAISDVLSSLGSSYDLVYAWDASGGHAGAGNWMRYAPGIPGNTLSTLDETQGFWIRMTTEDTLEITGTVPATTDISLSATASGWNLVGYPSHTNRSMPEALTMNGVSEYSLVYAYHADDADTWKRFAPGVPGNDLLVLVPGWGYWIKVDSAGTWHVEY